MQYGAAELENEKKVVEQAKLDPEAFGKLYEQNYDIILNYVLRRTGDVQVAQDITAETFFKALKNIGKFKWQNVPFSAWLYRIAINEIAALNRRGSYKSVSLDEMRDMGFEPISGDDVEQEMIAAQQEIQRHHEYLAVREQIDLLPAKYREVIALRFFAGKQHAAIASILGKPEGTVKSLLHRGLKKLKKDILQQEESATFWLGRHYE
ncbi:MAG TPA: RNA polymerase sigma factor [Candidatus Limnocylindrales bacterium]|nr:RNA polymerase sigma factor [Candidatus Limnocylindrales bacterium]